MSARVEKLAGGITVVTEEMPHLAPASLGIWVAAGIALYIAITIVGGAWKTNRN